MKKNLVPITRSNVVGIFCVLKGCITQCQKIVDTRLDMHYDSASNNIGTLRKIDEKGDKMKFEILADSIKKINDKTGNAAKNAVNQYMTLRNWVIGYYIIEYEQGGSDRADYGTNLLKSLELKISQKGMNVTLFKDCRNFYLLYPQISTIVSEQLELQEFQKSPTVSNFFETKPDVLISNLSFSRKYKSFNTVIATYISVMPVNKLLYCEYSFLNLVKTL